MPFKDRAKAESHINPAQTTFGVPYLWNSGYNKNKPPYFGAFKCRDFNRDADLHWGQPRQRSGADQDGDAGNAADYDKLEYQGLSNRDRYITTSPYGLQGTKLSYGYSIVNNLDVISNAILDTDPEGAVSETIYEMSDDYTIDKFNKGEFYQISMRYLPGCAADWDYINHPNGDVVQLNLVGNQYPAADITVTNSVSIGSYNTLDNQYGSDFSSFFATNRITELSATGNAVSDWTIQMRVQNSTYNTDANNTATRNHKDIFFYIKVPNGKTQKWKTTFTDTMGRKYFRINYTSTDSNGTSASRHFDVYASHFFDANSTYPDCYVIQGDDQWQFMGSYNYQNDVASGPFNYQIAADASSPAYITGIGGIYRQSFGNGFGNITTDSNLNWCRIPNTIGISQYGKTIMTNPTGRLPAPSTDDTAGNIIIFDSYDWNKHKIKYDDFASGDEMGDSLDVAGQWAVVGSKTKNKYRVINLLGEGQEYSASLQQNTKDWQLQRIDGSPMGDGVDLGTSGLQFGFPTSAVAIGYNKISFGAHTGGYYEPNGPFIGSYATSGEADNPGVVYHHLHFNQQPIMGTVNDRTSRRKYHELTMLDSFNVYDHGSQWYNINPENNARFGCSVAIGCGRLVVGADYAERTFEGTSGTIGAAGRAYLYDIEGGYIRELIMPEEFTNDQESTDTGGDYMRFGHRVAIGSGIIAVSAPYINAPNGVINQGNVFIYDLNGNFMFDLFSRTTFPQNLEGSGGVGDWRDIYMESNFLHFGYDIDVKYGRIAVGAPSAHHRWDDPFNANNSFQMSQMGGVFLYDLDGVQTHSFYPYEGTAQSKDFLWYGSNVKLGYGKLVIGAGYQESVCYDVHTRIESYDDALPVSSGNVGEFRIQKGDELDGTDSEIGSNTGAFYPFEISPIITPWDALEQENGWG